MTSILVVGDRASIDEELLDAFEREGIAVDRTRDAMSAIAYLDRNRAEVVLAASELPEWTGLRLLRHVESEHSDISSFLVVEAGSRDITRAQQADITPLVSDGSNWAALADVLADRLFEGQVEEHRDRRHHLAVATATVLLEALDSLKRASNSRKSTDLLRETAIVSTRDVVEESVCQELAHVPGYRVVWVSHYYPDEDELVPQAASGMDVVQLQEQHADVYTDAGIDLETGEVDVRQGEEHVEIVVPLRNDTHTHGTIHVQGRGAAISSFERDQLGNLGRIVRRFITALGKLQDLAEALETDEDRTMHPRRAKRRLEGLRKPNRGRTQRQRRNPIRRNRQRRKGTRTQRKRGHRSRRRRERTMGMRSRNRRQMNPTEPRLREQSRRSKQPRTNLSPWGWRTKVVTGTGRGSRQIPGRKSSAAAKGPQRWGRPRPNPEIRNQIRR